MIGSEWDAIDRPGYLGGRREERRQYLDLTYGRDNWQFAWKVGTRFFGGEGAAALYEDAYLAFLRGSPELEELVTTATDVYDDAPSNVGSGLDYSQQETVHTHWQDIAIRRCLVRLGRWFEGDRLIQIRDHRGDHRLSLLLSPGRVPFHRPDLLVPPELTGWWQSGSVESFYQSNRFILVRRSG